MEPLLIVDTAMEPMGLFNRLKMYYSGDAGTPPAVLFIGPEPFFSGRRAWPTTSPTSYSSETTLGSSLLTQHASRETSATHINPHCSPALGKSISAHSRPSNASDRLLPWAISLSLYGSDQRVKMFSHPHQQCWQVTASSCLPFRNYPPQSRKSSPLITMLFGEIPARHAHAFNLLALISILGMCLADLQSSPTSRSPSRSSTSFRSTSRLRPAPPPPLTGMPRRSSELVSRP
jgi:hypothetical protein